MTIKFKIGDKVILKDARQTINGFDLDHKLNTVGKILRMDPISKTIQVEWLKDGKISGYLYMTRFELEKSNLMEWLRKS
jgi:hypothetical protein